MGNALKWSSQPAPEPRVSWEDLPDDIIRSIISWLTPRERSLNARVSKLFDSTEKHLRPSSFSLRWAEHSEPRIELRIDRGDDELWNALKTQWKAVRAKEGGGNGYVIKTPKWGQYVGTSALSTVRPHQFAPLCARVAHASHM